LKLRLLDLTQVAYWAGQEAENEFDVSGEKLKHSFHDLTQVAFWASQWVQNESMCHGST